MKLDLSFDTQADAAAVIATVRTLDRGIVGHDATLTLVAKAVVHDRRAVNSEKKVLSRSFVVTREPQQFSIPRHTLPAYTYAGQHVDVELHAKLKVDDGVLLDTTIKEPVNLALARSRPPATDCKQLVEPKDLFKFWANWRAIPAPNQVAALGLAIAMAIIGVVNSWIGYHDQFAPESQTYVYSHRDSDGDSQSPLVNSTGVTGGIGAAVWYALRRQLRKYMTFTANKPPRIDRTTAARVNDLFRGRSRVPLHNIVLRIVACNMEQGQYKRGSGSNERTVSFKEPVRGLVLFEKRVAEIAAGAAVQDCFPETFRFAPIFDSLCPPNEVSSTHGVGVHWEIQLLHDQYVDQEIIGSLAGLKSEEFYEASPTATIESAPLPANF